MGWAKAYFSPIFMIPPLFKGSNEDGDNVDDREDQKEEMGTVRFLNSIWGAFSMVPLFVIK